VQAFVFALHPALPVKIEQHLPRLDVVRRIVGDIPGQRFHGAARPARGEQHLDQCQFGIVLVERQLGDADVRRGPLCRRFRQATWAFGQPALVDLHFRMIAVHDQWHFLGYQAFPAPAEEMGEEDGNAAAGERAEQQFLAAVGLLLVVWRHLPDLLRQLQAVSFEQGGVGFIEGDIKLADFGMQGVQGLFQLEDAFLDLAQRFSRGGQGLGHRGGRRRTDHDPVDLGRCASGFAPGCGLARPGRRRRRYGGEFGLAAAFRLRPAWRAQQNGGAFRQGLVARDTRVGPAQGRQAACLLARVAGSETGGDFAQGFAFAGEPGLSIGRARRVDGAARQFDFAELRRVGHQDVSALEFHAAACLDREHEGRVGNRLAAAQAEVVGAGFADQAQAGIGQHRQTGRIVADHGKTCGIRNLAVCGVQGNVGPEAFPEPGMQGDFPQPDCACFAAAQGQQYGLEQDFFRSHDRPFILFLQVNPSRGRGAPGRDSRACCRGSSGGDFFPWVEIIHH